MSYVFFHTVTQNEKLLLRWLNEFYPELKLSFSAPGWVTMKAEQPFDITALKCPLALRWGIGLDIIKNELDVLRIKQLISSQKVNTVHYFERFEIKSSETKNFDLPGIIYNQPLATNSRCLHIFKINENLYATGVTLNTTHQSKAVGALSIAEVPTTSPSRAYLKLAQVDAYFKLPWEENEIVLELGASPGGITTYLLEKNQLVHAVDSAPLKIEHPDLEVITQSVQRIHTSDLSMDTKWIVSDLNLSPNQTIKEVLRLSQGLNLKGIIITIKLTHLDLVKQFSYYRQMLQKNFPNFRFEYLQVPSHKQETHLVGF